MVYLGILELLAILLLCHGFVTFYVIISSHCERIVFVYIFVNVRNIQFYLRNITFRILNFILLEPQKAGTKICMRKV